MSLRVYWLSCSMCNVQCFSMELFQFGLYALILFLKCDVTKFRIPPLSYNAPSPLMCDVIYGWSLRSFSKDLLRRLDTFRCRTCHNQVNLLFLITTTIAGSIEISQLFFFQNLHWLFPTEIYKFLLELYFHKLRELLLHFG